MISTLIQLMLKICLMFEFIKNDYRHTCSIESSLSSIGLFKGIKRFFRLFFHSYGLQVIISYRFYRWVSNYNGRANILVRYLLRPIAFLQHKVLGFMYDIHISPQADIGWGFYIGHFGGIYIGCCTIGRWCNVNQQVTIGESGVCQKNMQVIIGDHVWVGAHSKIEPGIIIGNGATISVGTPVVKDIPPFSLVAGSSCRVLQQNYDNSFLLGLAGK